MYFQPVESQVLSKQDQPDGGVNLHRLTVGAVLALFEEVHDVRQEPRFRGASSEKQGSS